MEPKKVLECELVAIPVRLLRLIDAVLERGEMADKVTALLLCTLIERFSLPEIIMEHVLEPTETVE